ncbi:GlcG/HbpS family heme-binding protein [Noviherbaspirillum saxi]|uniref:Heme-binding protein n=1 Tax=Noviherbaspirillum saxi TaxID=2320863 RepID=A0A3A3FJU8_9BURK|nr:heme-binding protein [Noviherbaspirillum saxi]RJF95577.1 heme-binding protein [Noviherbaspirillum saxi]
MLTRHSLALQEAKALSAAAEQAAGTLGVQVSIVIVDSTTYAQVVVRMDGAPLMSAQGAFDKARTAAEGGHPTSFFEKPLNAGRYSMLKLPHTPIEGGVPVFVSGECVGAIGIAGAPPHLDAQIAESAIESFLKSYGDNR